MQSSVHVYQREAGEIQRVQTVKLDRWDALRFVQPEITPEALRHLAALYRDFFVKQSPFLYGELILFHVPQGTELPFAVDGVADPQLAAKIYMSRHPREAAVRRFEQQLADQGYFYVVKGKRPLSRTWMPYRAIGFLSDSAPDAALRTNGPFFTFDTLDDDSPYDLYGTPVGLRVKDGIAESPPLYHREALLVDRSGHVTVRPVELRELHRNISGVCYERPDFRNTPGAATGSDLVIVGNRIVAVRTGGHTRIPASGFVLHTEETGWKAGDPVVYAGMESICFGIQCGNSVVREGKKTETFLSPFYQHSRGGTKYPPGRYPMGFASDRAPRMVLGSDRAGNPMLLWAEGASKMHHEKGVDSCGATLSELGDLALAEGMCNAINLDGGGSAQILLGRERALWISDRQEEDNSESERPIPLGLMVQ